MLPTPKAKHHKVVLPDNSDEHSSTSISGNPIEEEQAEKQGIEEKESEEQSITSKQVDDVIKAIGAYKAAVKKAKEEHKLVKAVNSNTTKKAQVEKYEAKELKSAQQ